MVAGDVKKRLILGKQAMTDIMRKDMDIFTTTEIRIVNAIVKAGHGKGARPL